MTFRYHGNWCGPGWTAGQFKDAKHIQSNDYQVPAIDALDEACKNHDIDIFEANGDSKKEQQANDRFIKATEGLGLKAAFAGLLVDHFGPSQSKKRLFDQDKTPPNRLKMPRLRGSVRESLLGDMQEDDGMDWEEAPTTESKALVAVNNSTGGNAKANRIGIHGETPISNIPYSVRTPWDKVKQATLTYYNFLGTITFDPIKRETPANDHTAIISFRLNSPYDVRVDSPSAGTAEVSLGQNDTPGGNINKATYFDHWMSYYNYWSVVRSRYRFRFLLEPDNITNDGEDTDIEAIAYIYHHGQQAPPKSSATDGTIAVPHYMRREHDNMYYVPLNFKPLRYGESRHEHMNRHVASGDYNPNTFYHEVSEDEQKQTWHKANEVPPLKEYVSVYFQESPTSTRTNNSFKYAIRTEVTLEYDVQFKDLKFIYQWPTQSSAVSITNSAVQTT